MTMSDEEFEERMEEVIVLLGSALYYSCQRGPSDGSGTPLHVVKRWRAFAKAAIKLVKESDR